MVTEAGKLFVRPVQIYWMLVIQTGWTQELYQGLDIGLPSPNISYEKEHINILILLWTLNC